MIDTRHDSRSRWYGPLGLAMLSFCRILFDKLRAMTISFTNADQ
jgi:hypothetical protein